MQEEEGMPQPAQAYGHREGGLRTMLSYARIISPGTNAWWRGPQEGG